MKELTYNLGENHSFIYDPFISNRVDEKTASTLLVHVRLNEEQITQLSRFVWATYVQILHEFLDLDFDYFEENADEPFPVTKKTIQQNPLLVHEYLEKSTLWRDYIQGTFLFKHQEGLKSTHFIIGYKGVSMEDNQLVLSFYAAAE